MRIGMRGTSCAVCRRVSTVEWQGMAMDTLRRSLLAAKVYAVEETQERVPEPVWELAREPRGHVRGVVEPGKKVDSPISRLFEPHTKSMSSSSSLSHAMPMWICCSSSRCRGSAQRKGTCNVAHGTTLSHSRAGEEGWGMGQVRIQKKSVKGRQ